MSDRDRSPVEGTKDDSLSGTILDFTITYLWYINRGQKYHITPHVRNDFHLRYAITLCCSISLLCRDRVWLHIWTWDVSLRFNKASQAGDKTSRFILQYLVPAIFKDPYIPIDNRTRCTIIIKFGLKTQTHRWQKNLKVAVHLIKPIMKDSRACVLIRANLQYKLI